MPARNQVKGGSMRSRTISKFVAASIAVALISAACGDDKSANTPNTTAASGAVTPTTVGATTTTKPVDPLTAIGIDISKCGKDYDAKKGIVNNEILIGQSVPLSGTFAGFGYLSTALKAYFDYANAELNGVNGKKLKCKILTQSTVKTWVCDDVPITGVARQELNGKPTMELQGYGNSPDEDRLKK